jgi:DNA topoisomerase-2
MKIVDKSITDIINVDYLEYSMYTLENRAIPSVIDGFKPVHRKLVYSMLNVYKGKKTKVADLGSISSLNYHHGEASAQEAVSTLGAEWNNNCPVFKGHGNYGSRLVQQAGAPRYIFAEISPEFQKYFIDHEIAPVALDPANPEPAHYLPTIPWVLVNGIEGIAVGFATKILPRSIKLLTEEVLTYMKDPQKYLKADKPLPPTYPDFRGKVIKGEERGQWITTGIVDYVGKNTYKISELPIGYDREAYIDVLHNLLDTEKIRDFDDDCSENGFGFTVKVSPAQKDKIDVDPLKYFKLIKSKTENLTTLGVDGRLKLFNSVSELIVYFVEYRLSKFGEKLEYEKNNLITDIQEMKDRIKFISAVINRKVDFRALDKAGLLSYIETNITAENWGKNFISIPLYNCTTDAVELLNEKIAKAEAAHKALLKETPSSRYISVLK